MTQKNKTPAPKMTVPEVAAHFGVSMETVRRWHRGEGAKGFPEGRMDGRSLVFDRVAVLAWGAKR